MTTRRFDTKQEAVDYSMTAGDLIVHSYHSDFYVVAFESMVWAEKVGMTIVHDYSDLGVLPTVGESWD